MFRADGMRAARYDGNGEVVRSAFAPVVLPLAALIASLVRWLTQGSGNVYTALDKRFYVPDPDLGWRVSDQHPIWLGLEVCAIIAAIAGGLAVGGWIIRRREAKLGQRATLLRTAAWIVAAVPLVVPLAAFSSGSAPAGARDILPTATATSGPAVEGIAGSLELPAGRYEVVAHAGTSITAKPSAGGEEFDARFTKDVRGSWQGNPRDLRAPMHAEISVDAAAVDTGISQRSASARNDYLQVSKHPRITFTLDQLVAARPESAGQIAFRARGTLDLIGKTHAVDITGTLKQPDAAALARLGLPATSAFLLATADFSIIIRETALAPDAGDFDGDRIPVHVSLVLRHTGG